MVPSMLPTIIMEPSMLPTMVLTMLSTIFMLPSMLPTWGVEIHHEIVGVSILLFINLEKERDCDFCLPSLLGVFNICFLVVELIAKRTLILA